MLDTLGANIDWHREEEKHTLNGGDDIEMQVNPMRAGQTKLEGKTQAGSEV